jgi:hypothetical protein
MAVNSAGIFSLVQTRSKTVCLSATRRKALPPNGHAGPATVFGGAFSLVQDLRRYSSAITPAKINRTQTTTRRPNLLINSAVCTAAAFMGGLRARGGFAHRWAGRYGQWRRRGAKSLAPLGERDRSSLGIGLLKIDSQSASHVVVCAGLCAQALALHILSPELRLHRGFRAGAAGQRG